MSLIASFMNEFDTFNILVLVAYPNIIIIQTKNTTTKQFIFTKYLIQYLTQQSHLLCMMC